MPSQRSPLADIGGRKKTFSGAGGGMARSSGTREGQGTTSDTLPSPRVVVVVIEDPARVPDKEARGAVA